MPQGPSFWFDTRIYLAVAAILLAVISFYNHYIAIIGAVLLYALYLYGRERHLARQRALAEYLSSLSGNIDEASYHALQNLPLAIAIVDAGGLLHWRNSVLANWLHDIEPGQSLTEVWPALNLAEIWGKAGVLPLKAGDRYYHITHKPLSTAAQDGGMAGQDLMLLYITDVTGTELVRQRSLGAMPVLALIQIDNYDDVLKGLTESQRTAILGEVSSHLADWAASLDGFIKKFSEDTYIAIFNRRALDKLLADKFDILDKIRAIRGVSRLPVTLSMGVAADEPTVAALGQRAQAGLDLALGRGGDQAAVYVEGKVQFYGGKAKAVEKNTRVKARVVAQAIRDIMGDADLVLVMGHAGEDFDSLGAAMGVAKMARHAGKEVHIVVSEPGAAVAKLQELLPDYKEYEALLLTADAAAELIAARTVLFVVDTHRPELTAAPDLLAKVDRVVVIDHHRRAETFIESPLLVYLEPSASSTSELVTELLQYYDDGLDLTRLEASALYAGIIVDTKNFVVQTGVRTFEAASYLRRAGADPALVRRLFCVDLASLRLRASIINSAEMLPGGVVIATCPAQGKTAQVSAAQAADMLLNIEGVRVCFILFWLEEGGVGVSARSQGDINVQVIMEKLGGGGHQTAAGAQIKDLTIAEVKQRLTEIVSQYLEESESYEGYLGAGSKKTR